MGYVRRYAIMCRVSGELEKFRGSGGNGQNDQLESAGRTAGTAFGRTRGRAYGRCTLFKQSVCSLYVRWEALRLRTHCRDMVHKSRAHESVHKGEARGRA